MFEFINIEGNTNIYLLTDDYFLYYGLQSLLKKIKVNKIGYDGDYCCLTKDIFSENKEETIIFIDVNIFITGKWASYTTLVQHHPKARRVWLTRRIRWGMWPCGCFNDTKIFLKTDVKSLVEKMDLFVFKSQEEKLDDDESSFPIFTKPEKKVLSNLLNNKDIHSLAKKCMCSEKNIYTLRCSIQSKLGFKTADWMVFIYHRNLEVFNEAWIRHLKMD